jgi:hypothetical protein
MTAVDQTMLGDSPTIAKSFLVNPNALQTMLRAAIVSTI